MSEAPIIYGQIPAGLTLQSGWRMRIDEYGVSTASAKYLTTNRNIRAQLLAIRNTGFPLDTAVHCFEAEAEGGGGGLDGAGYITASYIGIAGATSKPRFSFMGSMNQEPIESHKNFATGPSKFGGTSQNPYEGAKFDQDSGQFIGFVRPEDGLPENWYGDDISGATSYMRPGAVIRSTYFATASKVEAEMEKMGRRTTSIPGRTFTFPAGWEYLVGPTMEEQVGLLFRVSTDYMLSGERGWAIPFYDTVGL